jgi:hypothetical protein
VGGSSSSTAWAWCLLLFLFLYSSLLAGQFLAICPILLNGNIDKRRNIFLFFDLSETSGISLKGEIPYVGGSHS